MNNQKDSFVCSFSGGKDSCLAIYRAIHAGGDVKKLITMFTDDGERSRSHGLHLSVVTAQSQAMNIPLLTRATSWNDYEKHFTAALTVALATIIPYNYFIVKLERAARNIEKCTTSFEIYHKEGKDEDKS